uniref:Si:dkey-26c10.5 n=1 Tax=Neogobius melanostomus TaxID=47308 RepID=A0A8C6SHM3_9GOBI
MEMEELAKEPEKNVAKDEGTSATKSDEETDLYSSLQGPTEDLYTETTFVTRPSKAKAEYFQDVQLWRRVSACFGVLCLILILVIVILAIKLQNGSSDAVYQETPGFPGLVTAALHQCCQSNQCAPGWLQFGESCFFLSTLRKTWDEAKKNCSDMRGDLAVVTSPSVQKFLTGNGRLQYWIGLRGNTWVNGKSLSQSYWSDKPTPGYCVMLRGDMASDKNWYKSSCTRLTYYICERPVPTTDFRAEVNAN